MTMTGQPHASSSDGVEDTEKGVGVAFGGAAEPVM